MANKTNALKTEEEISLRDLLLKIREWMAYLKQKWRWLLLFAFIGLACGLSYALFKKPEYKATISFVTDIKDDHSSFQGYAGLATNLGFSLGNLEGNNGLFSGDNIFDLMETRLMLQRTLLTRVEINGEKSVLINRYIEVEELRKKKKFFRNISFSADTSVLTRQQSSAINIVANLIIGEMDHSNGSIMKVSFTSKDEEFSQLFLTTLMHNVEAFYIATKTKRARETIDVVQKQLDSIRRELYGAMNSVASFQDFNQDLVRQGPKVQQQKSAMKVSINSAIYKQLVTNLESAKMALQRETPLFEIIDKPVLPLGRIQPGKVKWSISGAILGIILSAAYFLIGGIYQDLMGK